MNVYTNNSTLFLSGHTGYYLKLLIFVSTVLCLLQIAFQILLAVLGNDFVKHCEFLETLLRHVGLVRLDELDLLSITQWIAPEIMSFFGSIIVFLVLRRAAGSAPLLETVEGGNQNQAVESDDIELSPDKWKLLVGAGKVLSLVALCATGALQPSVLSVVYYIVFLGAATWWGCNKELERCEK